VIFVAFFANNGKGWYPQKIPVALLVMLFGTVLWWCGLACHDTEKRELNDYYTTDLGEFIFPSLPTTAKYESWQTPFLKGIGKGDISGYDWSYKVDDQGFEDPYRCPPWKNFNNRRLSSDSGRQLLPAKPNSYNLPCPEPIKQHHAYNEGWRFALIYLIGSMIMAVHGAVAQKFNFEPIMDNGVAARPEDENAGKREII